MWAKRHITLEENEKNWCDMKMDMLEYHKQLKGRFVPIAKLLSWNYDSTSGVMVAQNAPQTLMV